MIGVNGRPLDKVTTHVSLLHERSEVRFGCILFPDRSEAKNKRGKGRLRLRHESLYDISRDEESTSDDDERRGDEVLSGFVECADADEKR